MVVVWSSLAATNTRREAERLSDRADASTGGPFAACSCSKDAQLARVGDGVAQFEGDLVPLQLACGNHACAVLETVPTSSAQSQARCKREGEGNHALSPIGDAPSLRMDELTSTDLRARERVLRQAFVALGLLCEASEEESLDKALAVFGTNSQALATTRS